MTVMTLPWGACQVDAVYHLGPAISGAQAFDN
jgi:hypothetical protein